MSAVKRIHFTYDGSLTLCGTPYDVLTTAGPEYSDKVTCLRCLFVMPLLHEERMVRMQAVKNAKS